MIDDPIVIRKSRGLLVVSSSVPTDPIQLVRELSHDKLEVHLKNGTKYVEELQEGDDIQELILEMMGYGTIQVTMGFHAWPESQEGTLSFYDICESEEDEKYLDYAGRQMVSKIFNDTPYLNSKFLSLDIDNIYEESNIKYYDGTYSKYDVEFTLQFRGRVDQVKEIERAMEVHGRDFASYLCKRKPRDRMLNNDRWYNVQVIQ